jgi:2-polyprenyl-6-methoxyphenol hydroxylase-like FAD-dependent oxidoreductase
MKQTSSSSVIIIGAGPCGLMLAIELGKRGISAVVLEEKISPLRFPAANATQARKTVQQLRNRLICCPAGRQTDGSFVE